MNQAPNQKNIVHDNITVGWYATLLKLYSLS
jgi:hypothetical protein